jgi:hypothetical protein
MNDKRRKEIKSIRDKLGELLSRLETLRDDEQAAFDAIPENLAGSQRYEAAEEATTNLDDACDNLETVLEHLDEAVK